MIKRYEAGPEFMPHGIEPVDAPFQFPRLDRPSFPDRRTDITGYGAIEGGAVNNTAAVNGAIDACHAAGGGMVAIPAGVWLTGPIVLKSNVNLHLERDAELRFSTDFDDYLPAVRTRWEGMDCLNFSPLIRAAGRNNIAITGRGTLNGQGHAWWPWSKTQRPVAQRLYEMAIPGTPIEQRHIAEFGGLRPCFIEPFECTNVFIEGVRIIDGPFWTIHPTYCENVIIRGVSIETRGPNTDGVNPDSSRNVLIEYTDTDTGDDCVVIKSGLNEDGWRAGRASENIVVRHCRTARGHGGVVIGSEMSGDVRNVFATHCVFHGTARGLRIKTMPGRGGIIENITFQNIWMDRIRDEAVLINLRYSMSTLEPLTDTPPIVRNVNVSNITCADAARAVVIRGLAESPVRDVRFNNLKLTTREGNHVEHAESVTFD